MNTRLFADRHLADVVGMVLVDSVSERQNINGLLPMFKPWLEEAEPFLGPTTSHLHS
jgi:hypothetical protein